MNLDETEWFYSNLSGFFFIIIIYLFIIDLNLFQNNHSVPHNHKN